MIRITLMDDANTSSPNRMRWRDSEIDNEYMQPENPILTRVRLMYGGDRLAVTLSTVLSRSSSG